MTYPLVRDLAAEDIPARLTCGVLGFSTKGNHRWLAEPVSDACLADAYLTNAMIDAHGDDPAFGYRILADELDPNCKWVIDITEHPTGQGKGYCRAIKGLFGNRIVGCAISDRMTADLAVTMLRAAVARRRPDGVVIVHADRGSRTGFNSSIQPRLVAATVVVR